MHKLILNTLRTIASYSELNRETDGHSTYSVSIASYDINVIITNRVTVRFSLNQHHNNRHDEWNQPSYTAYF